MRDEELIKLNKRRLLITLLRNEATDSEKIIINNLVAEPDLQTTLENDKKIAEQVEKITENIATSQ